MSGDTQELVGRRANNEGLQPWAAFVVGSHPHLVNMWLYEVESSPRFNMPLPMYLKPKFVRSAFGRLNRALLVLALGSNIQAALLGEFRRLADRVRRLCLKGVGIFRPDPFPGVEWRVTRIRHCLGLEVEVLGHLLPPSSQLLAWFRLGLTVGRCLRLASVDARELTDSLTLTGDVEDMKTIARELRETNDVASLEGLATFAGNVQSDLENRYFESAQAFYDRMVVLEWFDRQLQTELRGSPRRGVYSSSTRIGSSSSANDCRCPNCPGRSLRPFGCLQRMPGGLCLESS
jgi:hypothetical protein